LGKEGVIMSALPGDILTAAAVRPRIVNHDIMNCTHESVSGNHLYSGRALGLTEPGDIIQLHPELRTEWPAIAAHYKRVGISHTDNVLWNVSHDTMADYPDMLPSVFFYGGEVTRTRPDPHWQAVVEQTNDKNRFMDLAETLGMAVPRTLRFANAAAVRDLAALPYPCYVKAAISVSGVGIYRCENADEVRAALAGFAPEVPLQVQQEVRTELFLNLQYEVKDGVAVPLAATEQVLDGFTHQGNRYPARYAPWESVEPMAQWMAANGMREVFAFDVGVEETPDRPRFLPIECNPRFNGASYPTAIANKLGLDAWLAIQLTTNCKHLAEIFLEDLEYNPETGRGVVIAGWGTVKAGKLGLLLAGSAEEQENLKRLLQKRLLC
jgi:hypothetical protein